MILGPWKLSGTHTPLWGYWRYDGYSWVWEPVGTYEDTLATLRRFRTVR